MLLPLRSFRRAFVSLALALGGLSAVGSPSGLSPKVNDLIERFFAPPEFRNLQLSPDGEHVSFEIERDGQMVLGTLNTKTGQPAVTAPAPRQSIHSSHWVGPDQLIFRILEQYKPTHRTGTDSGPVASMLPLAEKPITFYAGHWVVNGNLTKKLEVPTRERVLQLEDAVPHDPSRVFFVEQSSDKFYSPLYCYDALKNKARLFEANPGRVIQWHTDTAGHVRLATVAEEGGNWSHLYRETEQSPWQPLVLPTNAEFVAFDRTGQILVIHYPDASGRSVAQSFNLTERKLVGQPISDPVYDVEPRPIREPRTGTPRRIGLRNRPAEIHLVRRRV